MDNDVHIVGDSMLNGLDVRKMKTGNGNVKVRAHPGATVTDMLDYLKPISRKQELTILKVRPCQNYR